MVTVDASRVETRNVAPTVRSLPSLPVDILCIPGVTLWGPIMEAQVVYDYDDFTEKYHSYILDYETAVQVRQFFINGGRKAYVSRVVHMAGASPATAAKSYYTSQTGATAASHGSHTGSVAAPFNLANGDTLICDLDAVAPGVGQTWTCAATAGSRVSGNAEPYALVNLQTLFVSVNGELAQTVTFLTGEFVNIAAATAEECAAVINAKLSGAMATVTGAGTTVTITSDRLGTTSSIEITGGTAAAAFNFPAGAGAGGGNVPNAASVTITTLKPLLEAVWIASGGCTVSDSGGFMKVESDTTGATSKVQILAASTADTKVGFDNAVHSGSDGLAQDTLKVWGKYYGGTVGNSLTYDIAAASDGNAEHFNLVVYLDGIQRETHANLTMDTTVSDYVESRVNLLAGKSTLIEAEDKGATGTTLQRRPANATGVAMANGNDGLTALAEADFLGTETYGDGLHAFDTIDEGDILIIPDKITSTMYNSAISWCEGMKRNTVVLVADASAAADKTAVKALANALTPSEQCTGVMWPHVKIPNPDRTIYGQDDEITIAPSGTLAGLLARNTIAYERSGVFTQCGNETYGELLNVTGVESTVPKKLSVRRGSWYGARESDLAGEGIDWPHSRLAQRRHDDRPRWELDVDR